MSLRERYPRTWRFVSARFARGEYLGLHLTIGLAVCVVALWAFAGITEGIVHKEPLTTFDLSVLEWFRARRTPAAYATARYVTMLGSSYAIMLLGVGTAILLAVKRQGLALEGWIIAFAGGGILNQVLKTVIQRPRPEHSGILTSWSFPSGHAMESLIGYGLLAYLLIVLFPGARARRIWVIGAALLLILAIGFTRLYLGVHYFSDVIGGYAAGTLWLSACISGLETIRRRAPPSLSLADPEERPWE